MVFVRRVVERVGFNASNSTAGDGRNGGSGGGLSSLSFGGTIVCTCPGTHRTYSVIVVLVPQSC